MDVHQPHGSLRDRQQPMHCVPADPGFDFDCLLKIAVQQGYALERQGLSRPSSPAPLFDDDDESSLSSLPPSPVITASPASSSISPIFLNKDEALPAPSKESQKKKNPAKRKTPHRQKRHSELSKNSRKKRRVQEKNSVDAHHEPRHAARLKHLGTAEAFLCGNEIAASAAAKGAYVAVGSENSSRKLYRLGDLVGERSKKKFQLLEWDGSHSVGVVDKNHRIVVILAGHPDDKNWSTLQTEAAEALESRRSRCLIPKEDRHHRRGKFVSLNFGVSFGGGQRVPSNLHQKPPNEQVLSELNSLEPFRRVAGFASSVMANWAPKLHAHYQEYSKALHNRYPHLKRIFPACIFSAATYNFGPRTVCYPHNDPGNLPSGMCAVTPFGSYDYKKGGHLVLWELKLVVEFPPGCTVLLPSAVLTHFNVDVGKNERRYSFVQYTAGGLFRWVDQGFQTQEIYRASLSPEELAAEDAMLAKRWETGLSLIPTIANQ